MKDLSAQRKIEAQILRKKKKGIKRERFFGAIKQKSQFLVYIFFLVFLAYLLFYSPLFFINRVEVNELRYMDENEVKRDFEFLKGENFFLTDLSELREQVIKNYAFIENIYTEKVFPSGILVHIREKEPQFVAKNEQGCFLLDESGFVLLEGECTFLKANYSVREISGSDLENIDFFVNSQSNFYNAERIFEVINVLNYYGYSVKEVFVENQVAEFRLHDDRFFIFSFANNLDIQLKRFIIVKTHLDNENISFESIDFRYQRPVLVPE